MIYGNFCTQAYFWQFVLFQTGPPYTAQAKLKLTILLLQLLKYKVLLKLNYYFHYYSSFLRPHDK